MPESNLISKKVESVKFKYSPQKRNLNKYNQVFVKEYKLQLVCERSGWKKHFSSERSPFLGIHKNDVW
jgi:hypothetical protein